MVVDYTSTSGHRTWESGYRTGMPDIQTKPLVLAKGLNHWTLAKGLFSIIEVPPDTGHRTPDTGHCLMTSSISHSTQRIVSEHSTVVDYTFKSGQRTPDMVLRTPDIVPVNGSQPGNGQDTTCKVQVPVAVSDTGYRTPDTAQ